MAVDESSIAVRPIDLKAKENGIPLLLLAENENKNNVELRDLVAHYLNKVGTPRWERIFGKLWDQWETAALED